MGQPNWNVDVWNNIVKPLDNLAWPSFIIGSAVRLGDYGPLPSVSAGFRYAGNLFTDGMTPTTTTDVTTSWSKTYGSFKSAGAGVSVTGSYWDVQSRTEVTAGLQWGWTFESDETIIANLPQVSTTRFVSPEATLAAIGPNSPLFVAASKLGCVSNGQIKQGFGVVVGVKAIIAGLIVCSTAKGQTWSISGTATGMNLFMNGEAKGYYGETSLVEGTTTFITPAQGVSQGDEIPPIASTAAQSVIGYYAYTWNGKGGLLQYVPH